MKEKFQKNLTWDEKRKLKFSNKFWKSKNKDELKSISLSLIQRLKLQSRFHKLSSSDRSLQVNRKFWSLGIRICKLLVLKLKNRNLKFHSQSEMSNRKKQTFQELLKLQLKNLLESLFWWLKKRQKLILLQIYLILVSTLRMMKTVQLPKHYNQISLQKIYSWKWNINRIFSKCNQN